MKSHQHETGKQESTLGACSFPPLSSLFLTKPLLLQKSIYFHNNYYTYLFYLLLIRQLGPGWKLPDQSKKLLLGLVQSTTNVAATAAKEQEAGEKKEKKEKGEKGDKTEKAKTTKAAAKPKTTPKRRLVYLFLLSFLFYLFVYFYYMGIFIIIIFIVL